MNACLQASTLGLVKSLSVGGAARCKVSFRGVAGVGSKEEESEWDRVEGGCEGVLRYEVDWDA